MPSKKKRRKGKSVVASLTLTSLVDIFTIILLFLLMNYSVDSDSLVQNQKLKLPVSTSHKKPKIKFVIQISTEDIIIEGVTVAKISEVLESKDEFIIDPLLKALNENTKKTEFIARSNPSVKFTGDVLIQGDRSIPFVLLEKVMFTCGQASYGNISLAVTALE